MRILAAALMLVAVVASPAAAADEPTFGAAITPVPLIVEDWRDPAVSVENRGSVPITVRLELEGDQRYTLERSSVEILGGQRASVRLVSVGEGTATIRAIATNAESGMDTARIILETTARHRTLLEQLSLWWIFVVAAGVVVLVAGKRYLGRWQIHVSRS